MSEPSRPDYRALRPGNITDPAYRHILLLLYWPIHGLAFLLLPRETQPNQIQQEQRADSAYGDLYPGNLPVKQQLPLEKRQF